jgi:hypothetical protein
MSLALVLGIVVVAVAADDKKADDKEVTLKGKITCAKCDLKVKGQDTCATVIVVTEKKDGKDVDVTYYFDEKSDKDNHKTVCKGSKEGSVTGKVTEKDGKKTITASKVDFK